MCDVTFSEGVLGGIPGKMRELGKHGPVSVFWANSWENARIGRKLTISTVFWGEILGNMRVLTIRVSRDSKA